MCEREQRGLVIAATCNIKKKGPVWMVPSQAGNGKSYTVVPHEEQPICSCPDHEFHSGRCKHIFAVQLVIQRELFPDGTETETRSVTMTETVTRKTTYPQNWRAYNKAQTTEKASFLVLLHELCKNIENPPQAMGRPRIPLRDAIFSAVYKVYSTFSGRRFMTDLRDAHEKGFIGRVPSYNALFSVFEDADVFEVLRSLVVEAAKPLKAIDTVFAVDSTGFSGCRFDKWFDIKYGQKQVRAWVKAHCMTGTLTNCVTAVEIHEQRSNDGAQMPALLATTAKTFDVKEVSGDLAYTTNANLHAIDALGATPYIPFKRNAIPAKGGLWEKMLHFFSFHRDEFLSRYHQRSNVESTFSMIKAKFGDGLRSKTDVAMKNETLAKLVCHNICCVIQSMHEFGISPTFGAEVSVAQKVALTSDI